MEENIKILEEKLKIKQKELEDYVLDTTKDYLSEEAENIRKEIYDLQDKIIKIDENTKHKEDIDLKIAMLIDFIDAIREEYDVVREKQALENLIKRYRELEESNKILNDLYWNECIPKSKVKEKIEELEESKEYAYRDEEIMFKKALQVLQELMEDK